MKKFNLQFNIGKAKYVINYHDGVKTNKDGSQFYDIAIFKNKKKAKSFITDLKKKGYIGDGFTNKNRYYYIWIEGITARYGEKVKCFKDGYIEYTTKLTEAMRIRIEDKEKMKEILREKGIAKWTVESPNTFHLTNYAPPGTLLKL